MQLCNGICCQPSCVRPNPVFFPTRLELRKSVPCTRFLLVQVKLQHYMPRQNPFRTAVVEIPIRMFFLDCLPALFVFLVTTVTKLMDSAAGWHGAGCTGWKYLGPGTTEVHFTVLRSQKYLTRITRTLPNAPLQVLARRAQTQRR